MIIDHISGFELTEEERKNYFAERRVLRSLKEGLEFIYRRVRTIEEEIPGAYRLKSFSIGNNPEFRDVPYDFLWCLFRWYSVTAVDYVRMVGWLAKKESSKKAEKYLDCIIPEIHTYRNKVGAHAAFTQPLHKDKSTDLMAARMIPEWGFPYIDGRFIAGGFILPPAGQESKPSTAMAWSLTKTHEQLAKRYWPDT